MVVRIIQNDDEEGDRMMIMMLVIE